MNDGETRLTMGRLNTWGYFLRKRSIGTQNEIQRMRLDVASMWTEVDVDVDELLHLPVLPYYILGFKYSNIWSRITDLIWSNLWRCTVWRVHDLINIRIFELEQIKMPFTECACVDGTCIPPMLYSRTKSLIQFEFRRIYHRIGGFSCNSTICSNELGLEWLVNIFGSTKRKKQMGLFSDNFDSKSFNRNELMLFFEFRVSL